MCDHRHVVAIIVAWDCEEDQGGPGMASVSAILPPSAMDSVELSGSVIHGLTKFFEKIGGEPEASREAAQASFRLAVNTVAADDELMGREKGAVH